MLSLTVASGSLAGCGGSQPPIGVLLGSRYGAVPTERAHPDAGGRLGTVFSMTKSGKAVVLYRFGGGSEDGSNPYAGLTNIGDTLYGTTESGGAYNGGTAFAIAPSGAETVLHS
ncbi:MAG: choice-of-anchor tandem repeat GloVer-containing protein, partial [Candidatus Cybelea sp.]